MNPNEAPWATPVNRLFGVPTEIIADLLQAFEELTGESAAKLKRGEVQVALRVATRVRKA